MTHGAGELNQRVLIRREVDVEDNQGGSYSTLTTVRDAWAKVEPLSGVETQQADGTINKAKYLFVLRYRRDVPIYEDDRIEWAGQAYNILELPNVGDRAEFVEIKAERGGVV